MTCSGAIQCSLEGVRRTFYTGRDGGDRRVGHVAVAHVQHLEQRAVRGHRGERVVLDGHHLAAVAEVEHAQGAPRAARDAHDRRRREPRQQRSVQAGEPAPVADEPDRVLSPEGHRQSN